MDSVIERNERLDYWVNAEWLCNLLLQFTTAVYVIIISKHRVLLYCSLICLVEIACSFSFCSTLEIVIISVIVKNVYENIFCLLVVWNK